MSAATIVPIRGFGMAKGRLSDALTPAERETLAETLLRAVLPAAAPLTVFVVSNDDAVARVATEYGATVVADPGDGLDAAVGAGVAVAARDGHERVVVAHADLPFPDDLGRLDDLASPPARNDIVLVPDRRRDGTNVMSVPTGLGFRFRYGPGSFDRHLAEARRCGVEPTVVTETRLSWDVDLPEDLDTPAEWGPPPWRIDRG